MWHILCELGFAPPFRSLPTQDVSKRAIVTDWSEKSYFPLDGVPMDARIRSVGY